MASIFSRVNEILMVFELMVKPRASIVVFQSVLFFGAKMGETPVSPGPKNRTWSEAIDADAVNAVASSSEC